VKFQLLIWKYKTKDFIRNKIYKPLSYKLPRELVSLCGIRILEYAIEERKTLYDLNDGARELTIFDALNYWDNLHKVSN
jgi:hypothetical protein